MNTRSKKTQTLWLKPRQILIEEGSQSRTIFVLLSGSLSVEKNSKQIGKVVEYGEVIGELGALTGMPRTASVCAESVSEILAVELLKEPASVLAQYPSIMSKIDSAVRTRYMVQMNKIRMYSSLTATVRRNLLQEVICEANTPFGLKTVVQQGDLNRMRVQLRRRIDDELSIAIDPDDPRLLERLAAEHGVGNHYQEKLSEFTWLNSDLVMKMRQLEHEWSLIADLADSETLIAKAQITVDTAGLLSVYEEIPGVKWEMDIIRVESLLPIGAKIEALKVVYLQKHRDELGDDRQRLFLERQVGLAVQTVKANAGKDVELIINAARRLDVADDYETYVRNIVGLTETSTAYVDPLTLS